MRYTHPDLSGLTILVVEDQAMLALNLQIALEEAGAEAIIARGAHDALAQLAQFTFSAAIIARPQRTLIAELERRGVQVVVKPANRAELIARLAARMH